jgi:hypothetical protein
MSKDSDQGMPHGQEPDSPGGQSDESERSWDLDWEEIGSGDRAGVEEHMPIPERPYGAFDRGIDDGSRKEEIPTFDDSGEELTLSEPTDEEPGEIVGIFPDEPGVDPLEPKNSAEAASPDEALIFEEPDDDHRIRMEASSSDQDLVIEEPDGDPLTGSELINGGRGITQELSEGRQEPGSEQGGKGRGSARAVLVTAFVALAAAGVPGYLAYNDQRNQATKARVFADEATNQARDLKSKLDLALASEKQAIAKQKDEEQRATNQAADFQTRIGKLAADLADAKTSDDKGKRREDLEKPLDKKENGVPPPGGDQRKDWAEQFKTNLKFVKEAKEPAQLAEGVRRLIKLAVESNSPRFLEEAASELSDRADALITVCQQIEREEKDLKLRSRYELFESLLYHEGHDQGADAARGDRHGSKPAVVQRSPNADRPTSIRAVSLRSLAPARDPTARTRRAIQAAGQAINDDPDEPYLHLNKGRLCLKLAQKLETLKQTDESVQRFEEAAVALRDALQLLKNPSITDPEGHTARGIAAAFSEVDLVRQAFLKTTLSRVAELVSKLKTSQEGLVKVEAQLKDAKAKIPSLEAGPPGFNSERDEVAHWRKFGTEIASLVAFGRSFPEDTSQRGSWIDDLSQAVAKRIGVFKILDPPLTDGSRLEKALDAYASGLEALNRGDAEYAVGKFSEAIALNPRDARFYYFRGIALYLSRGRGLGLAGTPDAANDIRTGEALERDSSPDSRTVGLALVRIQGVVRQWVESIRNPSRDAPGPANGNTQIAQPSAGLWTSPCAVPGFPR